MENDAKIFVAGHKGMVGSAIIRRLERSGYSNLLTASHEDLDLTCQLSVKNFIQEENPEYIFIAAAKVGGIHANNIFRAEFIYQNLMIEANVLHAAWQSGVERLMFLGSSCVYPRNCPQPIKEEYLLTGPLEETNEPYAIAKIAGLKLCESYNRQYGMQCVSVMPTNLYGPNDNYDPQNSHVLPALIRKVHEAKVAGKDTFAVWGSGKPMREFLHVDDMADACVFLMERPDIRGGLFNIGAGEDLSIEELARTVMDVVDYKGKIAFDTTKPDGTPRKLLDVARMHDLGWSSTIPLHQGLERVYEDFLSLIKLNE